MQDNYIIIRKTENGLVLGLKKEFENMLAEIFVDCRDNTIYLNSGEFVEYKLSDNDYPNLYLNVTSDLSEMKAANTLAEFFSALTKGKHRNNYYIVRTYSQSALTYCCKLMRYFGEFERQLRELLYLVVIKTYGENWFEETVEKELSAEIKKRIGNNQNKIIESALEELTYEQLTRYIFNPKPPQDINVFFDEINDDSFFDKSPEEIKERIKSIRILSLWERLFFDNKELENLKNYIDQLRPIRNKVMHHKDLSKDEFFNTRFLLKTINRKIGSAIVEIETKNFADMNFDLLTGIKSILTSVISDVIPTIMKNMQDLAHNVILPIFEGIQKFDYRQTLFGTLADTAKAIEMYLPQLDENNEDNDNTDEEYDSEEKETEQ